MSSLSTRDEDYFCGQIFEELSNGPISESLLIKQLEKQNITTHDIKNCLLVMEKSGSIRKSKKSSDAMWQLSSELQSGDFSDDADPATAEVDISGLTDRFASSSIHSENHGNEGSSSISATSLPAPDVRQKRRTPPSKMASNELSVKSAIPICGEHSMGSVPPSSKSSLFGSQSQSTMPNNDTSMSERLSSEDTSLSSNENYSLSDNTLVKTPASFGSSNDSFSLSSRAEGNNSPNRRRSDNPSAPLPLGEGQMLMQTVRGDINGRTQSRHMYMSQSQRNPAQQTFSVGEICIETTLPVNQYQHTEVDPRLEPSFNVLNKILKVFDDPANKDLKPLDIAKKSGVGQSKKDVNKTLYHLEKKGVLIRKTEEGGKNPKWNKNHDVKFTDKQLQEWAAELKYSSSVTSPTHISNHYHSHTHNHTNAVQLGNNNRMEVNTGRQESHREEETERLSEQVVSTVQQNQ